MFIFIYKLPIVNYILSQCVSSMVFHSMCNMYISLTERFWNWYLMLANYRIIINQMINPFQSIAGNSIVKMFRFVLVSDCAVCFTEYCHFIAVYVECSMFTAESILTTNRKLQEFDGQFIWKIPCTTYKLPANWQ